MKIVASFFHFLLLQTLALCMSFLVLSYPGSDAIAGFAFFFLSYGTIAAVAAAAMLLNAATIFNEAFDD